jgi:hypothetical protein
MHRFCGSISTGLGKNTAEHTGRGLRATTLATTLFSPSPQRIMQQACPHSSPQSQTGFFFLLIALALNTPKLSQDF